MPELTDRLAAIRDRIEAAEAERAEAMRAAAALVKEASGQVSVTEMSRLLGLSRVTVYALLNE